MDSFFFMNQPTCILQNDFSWSEIEFKHNLINQDMITAVELNVHGPSFLFCEPVISRLLSKDKNAQYSWVAQSHRTPVSSTTGTQTLISWNDANPSIVLLLLCIVRLFFFYIPSPEKQWRVSFQIRACHSFCCCALKSTRTLWSHWNQKAKKSTSHHVELMAKEPKEVSYECYPSRLT